MPEQHSTPALHSKNFKTKNSTYYFDVKAAKNGNKYLMITQTSVKGAQRFYNTLFVFTDQIREFTESVEEMAEKVAA